MTDKPSTGNAFTMFKGNGFLSTDEKIMQSQRNTANGAARAKQTHQAQKELNK